MDETTEGERQDVPRLKTKRPAPTAEAVLDAMYALSIAPNDSDAASAAIHLVQLCCGRCSGLLKLNREGSLEVAFSKDGSIIESHAIHPKQVALDGIMNPILRHNATFIRPLLWEGRCVGVLRITLHDGRTDEPCLFARCCTQIGGAFGTARGGRWRRLWSALFRARDSLRDAKLEFERLMIEDRIEETGGNIAAAARELRVDRGQLSRLIKRHKIRLPEARSPDGSGTPDSEAQPGG